MNIFEMLTGDLRLTDIPIWRNIEFDAVAWLEHFLSLHQHNDKRYHRFGSHSQVGTK
jgi:hypothetical protein